MTHSNAGNVWVPDLCDKLHDGWLERIFARYSDVYFIGSPGIGRIGRTIEDALEMGEVIKRVGAGGGFVKWLEQDAGMRVFLDILDLLDKSPIPIGRHGADVVLLDYPKPRPSKSWMRFYQMADVDKRWAASL